MKPVEIVAISLAFLAIWLTVLSVRVSQLRLCHRVSFGDGGHRDLLAAMRAHGNTLEQTALYGLLALGCAALPAASTEGLLVCALTFGVARVLHAAGIFGRTCTGACRPGGRSAAPARRPGAGPARTPRR